MFVKIRDHRGVVKTPEGVEVEIRTPFRRGKIWAEARMELRDFEPDQKDSRTRGWKVHRVWDGSFHDAQWFCVVVAWASVSRHFMARTRLAWAELAESATVADQAIVKFQTRRLVRGGD